MGNQPAHVNKLGGNGGTYTVDGSVVSGNGVTVIGNFNVVRGNGCTVYGHYNFIGGNFCTSYGEGCNARGNACFNKPSHPRKTPPLPTTPCPWDAPDEVPLGPLGRGRPGPMCLNCNGLSPSLIRTMRKCMCSICRSYIEKETECKCPVPLFHSSPPSVIISVSAPVIQPSAPNPYVAPSPAYYSSPSHPPPPSSASFSAYPPSSASFSAYPPDPNAPAQGYPPNSYPAPAPYYYPPQPDPYSQPPYPQYAYPPMPPYNPYQQPVAPPAFPQEGKAMDTGDPLKCGSCGFSQNPAGCLFCGYCGTRLGGANAPSSFPSPLPSSSSFASPAPASSSTSSTMECVICLDEPKSILLIPCNHLCVCAKCSASLTACPLCRNGVTRKEKVYL